MHKFLNTPTELENYRKLFVEWEKVSKEIRSRGTQEFLDLKAGDTILLGGKGYLIIRVNIKSLRVKRLGFSNKNIGTNNVHYPDKRIDTIPVYLDDRLSHGMKWQ